jgi:hypothetical protein
MLSISVLIVLVEEVEQVGEHGSRRKLHFTFMKYLLIYVLLKY